MEGLTETPLRTEKPTIIEREMTMKARTTKAVLLAVAFAAPVAVQAASTGNLFQDIQSAANSGSVSASLRDGVVTLTGDVDSAITANAVKRAAQGHDGVIRVIDLLDHD